MVLLRQAVVKNGFGELASDEGVTASEDNLGFSAAQLNAVNARGLRIGLVVGSPDEIAQRHEKAT